jgi:hypothetical protein
MLQSLREPGGRLLARRRCIKDSFDRARRATPANGTYYQLYTDVRNVCRIYQMSTGSGEWKLWREGEPFNQRFTATISEDGAPTHTRCRRLRTSTAGKRRPRGRPSKFPGIPAEPVRHSPYVP